ncbi:RidA family protein [Inquilinus sp. YAF38]|uniref:RidA family protein n=1 Tax=Inquilinus sp. YAF38 TaxID=3233084 RepID=UPI003F9251BC
MIGTRIFTGSPYEDRAGYARAVVADGWVLVSGTTGFNATDFSFPEDVESQCENCFRNIAWALGQAGAGLEHLVRVVIYVTSQAEFERIVPIIRRHCDAARPANTTIFAQLVQPHMRVEIEATARLPAQG